MKKAAGTKATAVQGGKSRTPVPAVSKKVVAAKAAAAAPQAKKSTARSAPVKPARKAVSRPEMPNLSITETEIVGLDTGIDPPGRSKGADATAQGGRIRKTRLVRDSFAMPEPEYAVLGEVKKACLAAGLSVRKSELLRIGVALVGALGIEPLKAHVAQLLPLKSGRPKKG